MGTTGWTRPGRSSLKPTAATSPPGMSCLSHVRQLVCPTLVMHGQASQEPERVVCELIATYAPLGHRSEVPGAGHMAPLTHAPEVANLLRQHIGSACTRDRH